MTPQDVRIPPPRPHTIKDWFDLKICVTQVEEFLAEASGFADGSGNVDYTSFAQLMYSEE